MNPLTKTEYLTKIINKTRTEELWQKKRNTNLTERHLLNG